MIKGIYASGSGMMPRMLKIEVIANNLANINTTGFKRDSIFVQIMKDTAVAQAKGNGDLSGLNVREYTDFSEGSLSPTTNKLDLAIQGSGFFVAQSPNGPRYTRNGSFSLSTDGTLVTSQGYPVLGTGGAIQLPDIQKLSQGNISINETGEITVDGKQIGRLEIANFEDTSVLKKDGGSDFISDVPPKSGVADGKNIAIRQGYLEESNVNGIEEMVQMIELSRSFEAAQKTMVAQDSTLDKANDIGKL